MHVFPNIKGIKDFESGGIFMKRLVLSRCRDKTEEEKKGSKVSY